MNPINVNYTNAANEFLQYAEKLNRNYSNTIFLDSKSEILGQVRALQAQCDQLKINVDNSSNASLQSVNSQLEKISAIIAGIAQKHDAFLRQRPIEFAQQQEQFNLNDKTCCRIL